MKINVYELEGKIRVCLTTGRWTRLDNFIEYHAENDTLWFEDFKGRLIELPAEFMINEERYFMYEEEKQKYIICDDYPQATVVYDFLKHSSNPAIQALLAQVQQGEQDDYDEDEQDEDDCDDDCDDDNDNTL